MQDPAVASITMSLDDVGCFSKLLLALEDSQDQLGVIDYALGMSSLEDVFMALEEDKDDKEEKDVDATDKADASQKDLRDLEAAEAIGSAERTDSSEWRCAKAVFILRLKPVQASRFRFGTVVLLPFLIQLGGCYLATLGATDMDAGTNGYAIAIYPAMSFGFVLLSSGQDVMTDIKNKCKYVSMSQGLSARAYWLGNFMAHIVLLLPAAAEFVAVYLLLRPPSTPTEAIPMVILAILLYPIPLTLCVYNFVVAMAGSESVSKVVPVMLMATQLLPALITSIITAAYVPDSLADFANAWHVTLSVLNPNYGLPGLIAYIINVDGPKKLSVGGYFATLSALPLYMMFVTSFVCLFNLVRLDAGLYSETELQSP